MAGKPRFSITARRKDAPKGSKERVRLGSAWDSDRYPGSHRAAFDDVLEIVMKDGTSVTPEHYYFDLKDWSADGSPRTAKSEPGTGEPSGGSSPLPF